MLSSMSCSSDLFHAQKLLLVLLLIPSLIGGFHTPLLSLCFGFFHAQMLSNVIPWFGLFCTLMLSLMFFLSWIVSCPGAVLADFLVLACFMPQCCLWWFSYFGLFHALILDGMIFCFGTYPSQMLSSFDLESSFANRSSLEFSHVALFHARMLSCMLSRFGVFHVKTPFLVLLHLRLFCTQVLLWTCSYIGLSQAQMLSLMFTHADFGLFRAQMLYAMFPPLVFIDVNFFHWQVRFSDCSVPRCCRSRFLVSASFTPSCCLRWSSDWLLSRCCVVSGDLLIGLFHAQMLSAVIFWLAAITLLCCLYCAGALRSEGGTHHGANCQWPQS